MNVRTIVGAAVAAGIAGFAGAACAAPGVVAQGVNLRAGPGVDYPLVAQLPPGTPIEIYGCLSGWTWCDIAVNGARGWAAGVTLEVFYNNRPALLPQYGGAIGLPFIGFDLGGYWGRYYRGRPWYGTEDRWRGHAYGAPYGGPGGRFDGGERHDQRPGFRPDGRGPDGRGPDGRGPDGRGREGRGPEERGAGPVHPGGFQRGPGGPQGNQGHPGNPPGRHPEEGHDRHPDDHGPR